MLKSILLVALGGATGSVLRFLISVLVEKYLHTIFPWATFLSNMLGCLLIGLFIGLFEKQNLLTPDLRLLLIIGFCGGFTTFSAFASENLLLFQTGNTLSALLYMSLSVFLSLFFVWIGHALALKF